MEVRRLQKTGGSTFFVSLPKQWIKNMGLKQGDPIAIYTIKDGRLILDPRYGEHEQPKTAVIDIEQDFSREIIAKYLYGYDVIEIKSRNRISRENRKLIKNTIQRLIGVEIIEENSRRIVLQCLISPTSLPIDRSLKRMYLITSKMHEDSMTSLIENDVELAETVIHRDEEVDRLYFLVVRQIRSALQSPYVARKLETTQLDCLDYRIAAKNIEAIADCAVTIAEKVIVLNGEKIPQYLLEQMQELSKVAQKIHKSALSALLKKNTQLAVEALDTKQEAIKIVEKLNAEILKQQLSIAIHLNIIVDALSKIVTYAADIADLAF
ncbi:MAG: PhoU domain-containing protein [Candidatus Baldrarchaeia archaeon]